MGWLQSSAQTPAPLVLVSIAPSRVVWTREGLFMPEENSIMHTPDKVLSIMNPVAPCDGDNGEVSWSSFIAVNGVINGLA